MTQAEIDKLEKEMARTIDAAGWFEELGHPELVFSALLQIGYRRALNAGGSPHEVARRFHALLVGVLAEEARKRHRFRPHLVGDE